MIEKKDAPIEPNWLDDFGKASTPDPSKFGYVPLPTTVQGEPEGSVYMAHLRQENTIGSMLNKKSTFQLNEGVQENYDFVNYANRIPRDLIPYADRFFGATSDDDFKSIEAQLRQEIGDKSLLAAHPWKALAYSLDPLEPTNWIPGGVIYKEAKLGAAVGRSLMGGAISAAASTGLQEAILHQNQLTRTMQESIFNTVGAGIVGGVISGGLSAVASRRLGQQPFNVDEIKKIQAIHEDVNAAINPEGNLSAAKNATMDDAGIARMPKFIAASMKLSPLNRLLNSPFKAAQWFGSAAYEHNYELVKNTDGITAGVSMERSIKMEMRANNTLQIDHMNYFYDMHGVTGKYFKATRKKMGELGTEAPLNINLDQFNKAVYETALTGADHAIPQVNKAANLWRGEFDRLQKQAIDLGLLPPDVTVPNAPNYIMVMYNKNKIIEEGGKSARGEGTFSQHLYDQFEASNETTKHYLQSPGYTTAQELIKTYTERMKAISPEQATQLQNQLVEVNKKVKELETLKTRRPTDELNKIDAEINSIQAKKKELQERATSLQNRYAFQIDEEIKSHLSGNTIYEGRIKTFTNRASNVDRRISSEEKNISELTGRIKEIKESSPKKERLQAKLVDAKATLGRLKNNAKEIQKAIKDSEDFIKSHNGRIKELNRIKSEQEPSVPSIHQEIKRLDGEEKDLHASKKVTSAEIRSHEKAIRELDKEKKRIEQSHEISKEEKEKFAAEIERLEKEILDNAPQGAKTWEGKLHNVIEGFDAEDTQNLIWTQVEQTIDNILGDSDGKLLNPFLSKLGGETRPFKARKLIIDQLQASPWHITDIQRIAEAHNRAMVPTIKLTQFAKQHGYKDINDMVLGMGEAIRKEFDIRSEGLTGKEAQKMRAQYESAIGDMQAAIQMLQGVYGQGFNILNSKGAEFFNNVMNWNYTRMLGHMTLASLPELGLIVMRNGLMTTLAHGIGESFSVVKTISKNDLRAIGYGIETELASQFKSYIEHHGLSTNPSPFTKTLDSLTKNFGNLSLMNPWTDMVHNLAGHIAINKILTTIHKVVDGKTVSKKETTNLARLGIAQDQFADIAKFTKDNIHNGTRFADWTNWDVKTAPESNALKAFQAAVAKSIDDVAITPHFGDKPLVLQQRGTLGSVAKLMFQFKSYLMAATNRILYSGIQNRNDINLYLGVVSMTGLGMLGYMASSVLRGKDGEEIDLTPQKLLREGLDRSGVLGIFGEGINIGQKMFQLGEVSRYKSRDGIGNVLGPTGGSVSELVSLFNKINPLSSAKSEWTTKDAEAVMKLMPMQNLFYIQKINRQLGHSIAESLGATPTT